MKNNVNIANSLVLIVDDVPENIQVLGSVIRSHDFQVAFATSGIQALKIASVKKPDLIMLDVTMPEMDGFEVCKQLKSNPETAAIPVIFLTARVDIDDIIKGFDVGAVDYVTKPFNSSELIARVKTHLELKISREVILKQNDELENLADNLREENQAKDKFFSIMAHDLKSPFAGMIGIAEVLFNNEVPISENDYKNLSSILLDSIKQQYKLFDELLEWGKLRIKNSKPTNESFELIDAVFGVEAVVSNFAKQKEIEISHNIPNGAVCFGDINQISSVIRNFVNNAIKFTPHKGKIKIDYQDLGDRILISVIDNGIGMSENVINTLFKLDKIFSEKGTDNEEGNGLGLMICKEIVSQAGGAIKINSKVGEGTTFSFDLPKSGIINEN